MIFPIGDDNSDRTTFPFVNVALIVINVLVFVLAQGMGNNSDFTYAFSTVPAEILSGKDIVTADEQVRVNTPEGPRVATQPGLRETPVWVYLTILTAMFMHGGIAHLAGNMWFLWIFGDNIEHDMGPVRYLCFYLLSGLLATAAHIAMNMSPPDSMVPSLGASGAISGVMGAYLVLHPQRRVTVLLFRFVTQVPGFVAVGMWFVLQVVSSMGFLGGSGGVAYGAHIGGFLAGAALAYPFSYGRIPPPGEGWRNRGRTRFPLQ
ncbi:rhomboid family intramembrane serine protease [Lignipirellula cremea]|uniref:Rhomboid protease GluP n=1 Tax=Lignipirellula cremea TaxID=2528010 RepID=A0A518DTT3_9BACT|nr:rhomboid family intramembrane serine protease [Lignipirellula cremea]QDU95247.1 Rhomboid protease GluP [Lignipirellula cremea]